MAALGAELTLVPSEGGRTTKKLILDMIETARVAEPGAAHVLDRPAQQPRQHRRLPSRWARRSGGRPSGEVDAFVHCVGHGGVVCAGSRRCSSDTSRASGSSPSSRPNPRCCWAVRPGRTRSRASGSATRLRSGSRVSWTRSCRSRPPTRRRWRGASRGRRALFAGTSSGANVLAAIRVAERLGPDATVVTLMADSGLKYLSTDVYRSGGLTADSR